MNGPMGEESHGSNDGAKALTMSNSQSSPSRETEHQNSLSTPTEKKKTLNAFAMMMSGSKPNSGSKKRKLGSIAGSKRNDPTTTTSKFVRCPVGCGKHILPHEMNKHLDACLKQQAAKRKQEQEIIKRKEEELEREKEFLESMDTPESPNEPLNPNEPSSDSTESIPVKEKESEPTSTPSVQPPDQNAKGEDRVNEVQDNETEQQPESPTSVASKTSAAISENNPKPNNAFAHMMKNSAKVFSEQEAYSASSPKLFERIHLDEDGRVSLTCYSANRMVPLDETIAWSATIQVRGKKEAGILPIDLLVTSSIPSSTSSSNEPERTRLVRKHSRLSVPVLKSILQKGIRRRKPLPSVRVASEIVDKNLNELLRRLPIIILEDSTMHPEFPFLVWLMMAVSKDYQPPLSLLKKILGIVFEMASCRWQDSLISYKKETEEDKVLTLASLHKAATTTTNKSDQGEENSTKQTQKDIVLNDDKLIVWSILMRAQYGGMACDMRMLQGYAEAWHKRFQSIQRIPNDVKKRLSPRTSLSNARKGIFSTAMGSVLVQNQNDKDHSLFQWNQVPRFIHESAAKHSASRIERLLVAQPTDPPHQQNSFVGLSCLNKVDLTIEGVDFHCSSVLESAVLCDTNLVKECFVKLANGPPRLRAAGQDRRSWLEGLLKSCMWKFSGGVNFRMPLLGTNDGDDNDSDLKDFYSTLIKPRVDAFSERYIDERISKR